MFACMLTVSAREAPSSEWLLQARPCFGVSPRNLVCS